MAGGGIRGIRPVASESWDDDFLWQHSSCDDLHLPSASHGLSSSSTRRSNRPLGTRTSTKTSSRSSYSVSSESNNAAAGQLTETSIRPNKGSSSSTASYTSTQSSNWGYPSQLSLHDSSPDLEFGSRDRMLSFTSGQSQFNNKEADEEEEEDPTITLTHARLYGVQNSSPSKKKPKRASIPIPSAAHSLLGSTTTSSSLLYAPLTATGLSPPSSAPSTSLSSWRSPTPSLTLSDRGQFTSGSMMLVPESDDDDDGGAVTETDNETEMEFDTGSRDGHSSGAAVASGSTPRYATFAAALFGSTGSPAALGYEEKAPPALMPPERNKKRGTISFPNPFAGTAGLSGRKTSMSGRSNSTKSGNSRMGAKAAEAGQDDQGDKQPGRDLQTTTFASVEERSEIEKVQNKKHHRRSSSKALAFARLPFSRSTSSSTSTSTSSTTSAVQSVGTPDHPAEEYGISPPTSYNYLSSSAQSSRSHFSNHLPTRRDLGPYPDEDSLGLGRSTPTTIVDLRDEIYRNRTLRSRNNTADGVMSLSDVQRGQENIPHSPLGVNQMPYAQTSAVSLASTMASETHSFPFEGDFQRSNSGTSRRPTRKLTKRQEPSSADPSSSRSNTIRRIASPSYPMDGPGSRTYAEQGQLRGDSSIDDLVPGMEDMCLEEPPLLQEYQSTTSNQSFSKFKLFRSGSSSAGGSQNTASNRSRSRKSSTSTSATSRRAIQSPATASRSHLDREEKRPPSPDSMAAHTALMGANVKTSAIPFPSPERKPSRIALRRIQSVDPEWSRGQPAMSEVTDGTTVINSDNTVKKKPKRPLSLTGILSRSTSTSSTASTAPTARELKSQQQQPQNRTRSGTVMAAPQSAHPAMQSFPHASIATTTTSPLAPTFSFGTNGTLVARNGGQQQQETVKGGRRYLHRSTMSSGSVPTAKALQAGVLDRRLSVDFSAAPPPSHATAFGQKHPRRPPAVQSRRSFNPLFRSTTALPDTIVERPLSTLSLLSDTSTVRPLPPQHQHQQSEAHDQSGTPTLRRRHLPSLSLTLLPGSTAPLGTTTSTPPVPRAHTADLPITGPAPSPSPSGYFASLAPSAKTLAASPGGRSTTSSSNGSVSGLVRRVSLSDLRIPPRISSAQAKIGQDLQRVKEFKDGVEELKRLRKIYRTLVSVEDNSDTSFVSDSSTMESVVSAAGEGHTSTMLSIPVETTAKVDHIFTRVALDYRQWWEIADVLINLADGAEVVETEDLPGNGAPDVSTASQSLGRARCISEMPVRTGSSSPTPAPRLSNSSMDRDIGIATSSPVRGSKQYTPAQSGDRTSYASDEGVDVSTPTSPVAAATAAPSPSAIGRSPPVLVRSQSTSVFPTKPTSLSSGVVSAGDPHIGLISESRRFGSPRSQSLNASERQLEILRSMLKKSSTSPRDGTAPLAPGGGGRPGYLASVADESTPSSPVPSRLTAKPYLTPEKRLPTSFSLPAGLGDTTPTSTPVSSAKSAVTQSESSSSLGTPTARQRQESGKSKADTAFSSEGGGCKRSKNRLREVSRAGMQSIREFLKALTKSGASLTVEEPALPNSSPSIRIADPPTTAAAAKRAEGRTPVRPDLSMTRRVVSDSPIGSIRHSCRQQHLGHQHTPVRGNLLSAALMSNAKGSPLSLTSRSESGSSSDEEEDWDRHSSEDEAEEEEDQHHGKDSGGQLLRSDTQATILASSSSALPNAAGLPEKPSRGPYVLDKGRRRKSDGPIPAGTGSGRVATSTTTTTLRLSADSWQQGTKLVMTTEAMPTLLAKIDEVKLHCASCVTELRNVTV